MDTQPQDSMDADDPARPPSSLPDPAPDVAGVKKFDRLLAECSAAVRLYVRSLMPGYEGADDLAQETLLRLWEKREQFIPGSNFKAWAFQIVKYLVLNQRRKLARSRVVLLDEEMMDAVDRRWLETEPMLTDAHHTALTACLEQLKPEDQRLLHARYATDVSLETYAQSEGTRPGTLKARLFRLRDALRECIERRITTIS